MEHTDPVLPMIKSFLANPKALCSLHHFLLKHNCYMHKLKATFYPGLCDPTSQGGLGFDYYVNLSAPEMWSSFLKNIPDHEWSMSKIVSALMGNRQYADRMLVYAENPQSMYLWRAVICWRYCLVKSTSTLLARQNLCLEDVHLHKMIRMITFTIGGRAYLNFMGNEFGHPKRVEFPMASNKLLIFACSSWYLLSNEVHHNLFSFDKDLMNLDENNRLLSRGLPHIHHVNDTTMVISYIRGPLLFVFNFHPTEAYERYSVGVEEAGEYQIILNTDEKKYGGQGLVDAQQHIQRTISRKADGLQNCLELPLPSRTAQVESHIHAA
ncbi:LOW QUALITY PROTEIN: Branching enzyme 1 [Populus alba x Populus x berolinensis]|nr:LOW QUALITY PROTEIN: Branching enzyme 1 [Populus alba x Populus x berolinensis]